MNMNFRRDGVSVNCWSLLVVFYDILVLVLHPPPAAIGKTSRERSGPVLTPGIKVFESMSATTLVGHLGEKIVLHKISKGELQYYWYKTVAVGWRIL